jgi:hypothetical protein
MHEAFAEKGLPVAALVFVMSRPSWLSCFFRDASHSSGRRKTCAHQNDIVWTLFDPVSTTFIHF